MVSEWVRFYSAGALSSHLLQLLHPLLQRVKLIDLADVQLQKQIANFAEGSEERGQTLLKQQMADLRYPKLPHKRHVSL